MKIVRGIYGDAVERGSIGRNPFTGVDALRETAEDVGRVTLSAGEMLDQESAVRLREYASVLKPSFERAAQVMQDEV